ncbi:MAG: RidA family protein [Tepidisphaeraceae bacterium]
MSIEAKLAELSLVLPPAVKPVAAYLPVRRSGDLLFVSGQLPMKDGKMMVTGKIPSSTGIDNAAHAAEQCVLNALAAVKAEIGDLEKIKGVVRIGVFVQSDHTFAEQHLVANGASELLGKLFGESGRHARAAVGVNSLPLNASVEVEFLFQL